MDVKDPNTLYVKKSTMNRAEIIFDNIDRAVAWDLFLKQQHVQNVKLVWKIAGTTYFGFKMFRCRYQMPALILQSNREDYNGT